MLKNSKITIYILVILITLISVSTVFVTKNKTTITNQKELDLGYKTYTNNKYGFQFQYPTEFTISEQLDDNATFRSNGQLITTQVVPSESISTWVNDIKDKVNQGDPSATQKLVNTLSIFSESRSSNGGSIETNSFVELASGQTLHITVSVDESSDTNAISTVTYLTNIVLDSLILN